MTIKRAAKARDYMARNLVVLAPEMDVLHAIGIFVEKQISGAPVLDRFGTLVGMLSEKDCMRIALTAGYYGEWGGRVRRNTCTPRSRRSTPTCRSSKWRSCSPNASTAATR